MEPSGEHGAPRPSDRSKSLRRLQREASASPFVFLSERGAPFSTAGFARMLERTATAAGLELKVHPHMLRHACGFALANKATTPEACRRTSDIEISSTPSVIRN
jgi:integrase